MPRTPDRRPGPLEEDDQLVFDANMTPPTVAGGINYNGTSFQLRDAIGTFDPRTPASSGVIRRTLFVEATSDVSTTSATFAPLFSVSDTFQGGPVLIWFSASASGAANNTNIAFRVLVDGVPQRGSEERNPQQQTASAHAIVLRRALAPGPHTISVEWLVSTNLAQVRAATMPSTEHASLLVQEISP